MLMGYSPLNPIHQLQNTELVETFHYIRSENNESTDESVSLIQKCVTMYLFFVVGRRFAWLIKLGFTAWSKCTLVLKNGQQSQFKPF